MHACGDSSSPSSALRVMNAELPIKTKVAPTRCSLEIHPDQYKVTPPSHVYELFPSHHRLSHIRMQVGFTYTGQYIIGPAARALQCTSIKHVHYNTSHKNSILGNGCNINFNTVYKTACNSVRFAVHNTNERVK